LLSDLAQRFECPTTVVVPARAPKEQGGLDGFDLPRLDAARPLLRVVERAE
jgi:hypothetical protein